MNDMRAVIVPKSDQINADDLLGGPMTITVKEVSIRPGTEQPVSIHFEGDAGKPYKPCKSMARVMVHCWGPDANQYVGRSMTLYCDAKVMWGGMPVGGIRISHMTDIKATQTMALTATKGSRKPFVVQPLKIDAPKPEQPSAPKRTIRDIVRDKLAAAVTADDVHAVAQMPAVKKALAEAPDDIKEELGAMLTEAMERTAPADEPSDDVTSEAPGELE